MPDLPGKVRPGPLNLRQIEVFHAIMITGSLSAAGRLLHVSQPAISRTLAAIELRLGFSLFERFKGRLHPTEEARKMFEEVETIQQGVGRLNQMAVGMALHNAGQISVVSSPSFGEWLIPETTERFLKRNPGVQMQYRPLAMDVLLPQLLLGHADVAISTFRPEHPNLITSELRQGEILCVLPSEHKLAYQPVIEANMLTHERLVGYEPDTPLRRALSPFWAALGQEVRPMVEVRSAQTACSFVRSGVGIALVDSYGLMPGPGIVIRRIKPSIDLSIHITHSRIQPPSSVSKAFVTQFLQTVKRELPTMMQRVLASPQ